MNTHNAVPSSILVVDSDPLNLMAVAAVLNTSGHECYCAQGGEAALKAVRGLDLDLVVIDLDMGDVDEGLELAAELHQVAGPQGVPFILASGSDSEGLVTRAHQAGASYYLQKPFDPDVLLDLVGRSLWMPHLLPQTSATPTAASGGSANQHGLQLRPHTSPVRDPNRVSH